MYLYFFSKKIIVFLFWGSFRRRNIYIRDNFMWRSFLFLSFFFLWDNFMWRSFLFLSFFPSYMWKVKKVSLYLMQSVISPWLWTKMSTSYLVFIFIHKYQQWLWHFIYETNLFNMTMLFSFTWIISQFYCESN